MGALSTQAQQDIDRAIELGVDANLLEQLIQEARELADHFI